MMADVVFLGTPEFAVPTLSALIESPRFEVRAVITQPDRKAGRGQRLTPPPVKLLALENELPVFQFPRIRNNSDAMGLLEAVKPVVCIVVAFGQILPAEFFDYPPKGTLNVHASLLPSYRGAAPVAHAVWNGESETGVTIMKIDEGMDTGDILSIQKVPVLEELSTGELESILAVAGAQLLIPTLEKYLNGALIPEPQNHELATYAPRITKKDGRIDWRKNANSISRQVRAMNPWPGAFAEWRGGEVKIWKALPTSPSMAGKARFQPGRVATIGKEGFQIECKDSTFLTVREIQLPNRKRVPARDFVNGSQLKVDEVFH
jgi:methionyl-tRNA formyltransferase